MKPARFKLAVWAPIFLAAAHSFAFAAAERLAVGSSPDLAQDIGMEVARQDLVEKRLDELVTGLNYLKLDLQSNGKLGVEAQKRLETIMGRLRVLKEGSLAKVRGLLRDAAGDPERVRKPLKEVQRQVDQLCRELGSLLLQAGMSHAAEVFAAELHDLGVKQEALVLGTESARGAPEAKNDNAALAAAQKELGETLERLLNQVGSLADYETTEALAAVRVSRARKALEENGTAQLMIASARSCEDDNLAGAQAGQMQAFEMLRRIEIQLRPEARLQALVRAKNDLADLKQKQMGLRREAEGLQEADFDKESAGLARREEALLSPLGTISASLGIDDFIKPVQVAAGEAAKRCAEKLRPEALAADARVEELLVKAIDNLVERIAAIQQLDENYGKLQAGMNRRKTLQDLQDRQAQIIDDTDASAAARKSVAYLADPERALKAQVERFVVNLPKDMEWAAALSEHLNTAGTAMTKAEEELRKNNEAPAREAQFQALYALNAALHLAEKEVAFLEQLWTLTQLASDMNEVSRYIRDLEAEQKDVRGQVEKNAAAAKSVLDLTGPQELLARADGEVEETAALITEAHSIETLLNETKQAMAQAALSLGKDKAAAAIPLQKEAEEKLAKTRAAAAEMAARAEYMTRWIASMEKNVAIGTDLLLRQVKLRKKTEAAKKIALPEFEPEQTMLKSETEVWTAMEVSGDTYGKAAGEMGLAAECLKNSNQVEAVKHQKLAEELLKKALDEMFKWLASLEKMRQQQQDPQDLPRVMSVLNRLLIMAMGEEDLRSHTKLAVNQEFAGLATKQDELKQQMENALSALEKREYVSEPARGFMNEAKGKMELAAGSLKNAERAKALDQEIQTETAIRKAIAQLMVEAFTPPKEDPDPPDPNAEKPNPDEMETPPPPPNPKGDWNTFLKSAVKGDTVARDKQRWESLGQRDRGALNENFARELPLEYRDVLKAYYKALAK